MSLKLSLVAAFVLFAVACVQGQQTQFPAPTTPYGPHTQCGKWRAGFSASAAGTDITAQRVGSP